MKTGIVQSIFGGGSLFLLGHTAYLLGAEFINMVHEVRKANDEVFLGIGTWVTSRKCAGYRSSSTFLVPGSSTPAWTSFAGKGVVIPPVIPARKKGGKP
jgi:hypothetical protein